MSGVMSPIRRETAGGRATVLLHSAKASASKSGMAFDLTHDWVVSALEDGECAVTGIKFDLSTGRGYAFRNKHAPSIDRIDSSLGYTQDNCQIVIQQYNMAKGMWTDGDVLEMAIALLNAQS